MMKHMMFFARWIFFCLISLLPVQAKSLNLLCNTGFIALLQTELFLVEIVLQWQMLKTCY
jgi:hypothetical protein